MVTTNQKSTIYTQKRKRNLNTTLKTIMQLPEKRTKDKEKEKRPIKTIPKQLTVNGLNAPPKRHRLAKWLQK